MDYDHSRKVGNRGDVWKHGVLVALADAVATRSNSFRYVESHSGAPIYRLTSGSGEWKNGVGKLAGCDVRYESMMETWLGRRQYPAGWVLVADRLSQRFARVEIVLFDDADRVAAQYPPASDVRVPANVQLLFRQADGYASVERLEGADLVFLDPPYYPVAQNDWNRLSRTCRRLRSLGIPFAAWYPFFWPTRPRKLVDSTGCESWEVTWDPCRPKPSQNLKGCGVLVSDSVAVLLPRLHGVLRELSTCMKWDFRVRRP